MMQAREQESRLGKTARLVLAAAALLLIALFAGLGTWQVQRLQWKLALIERVESRAHSAPVAPPPPARWGHLTAATDEYRRVKLQGFFLYDFTTPVLAVSELGSGWWLVTPFCTTDGYVVLVNRGFVPTAQGGPSRYAARSAEASPCGKGGTPVSITGLLRVTEPKGGFLRQNDPAGNRWFSRDVQAIAKARGLSSVAPYFVDAAKGQDPADAPDRPVGGLTVIKFQNSHLVYAITWYALALMVAAAWWFVARGPRRS